MMTIKKTATVFLALVFVLTGSLAFASIQHYRAHHHHKLHAHFLRHHHSIVAHSRIAHHKHKNLKTNRLVKLNPEHLIASPNERLAFRYEKMQRVAYNKHSHHSKVRSL